MSDPKTDVWMPLWIGAYLADTMAFTTEQHGAYLLLILAYWRERAPLPDDDEALRGITKLDRADWKRIRPVLARKFRVADGVWWHKRVEQEMAAADARAKKAAEKASKAAQARWQAKPEQATSNAPSMPQALPKKVLEECPPPSPSSPTSKKVSKPSASHPPGGGLPPGFLEFWQAWPKNDRKQDKGKCADLWREKRLIEVADQILADVRAKRGTTKWAEGYIEAPLVYLRNRRWEDGNTEAAEEHLGDWRASKTGVERMAKSLGLPPWDQAAFEAATTAQEQRERSFAAYEARVVAVLEEREGVPA